MEIVGHLFGHSALGIGGIGVLVSSAASALVVAFVRLNAPKGEAFDAALLEALDSHQARPAQTQTPATVLKMRSRRP